MEKLPWNSFLPAIENSLLDTFRRVKMFAKNSSKTVSLETRLTMAQHALVQLWHKESSLTSVFTGHLQKAARVFLLRFAAMAYVAASQDWKKPMLKIMGKTCREASDILLGCFPGLQELRVGQWRFKSESVKLTLLCFGGLPPIARYNVIFHPLCLWYVSLRVKCRPVPSFRSFCRRSSEIVWGCSPRALILAPGSLHELPRCGQLCRPGSQVVCLEVRSYTIIQWWFHDRLQPIVGKEPLPFQVTYVAMSQAFQPAACAPPIDPGTETPESSWEPWRHVAKVMAKNSRWSVTDSQEVYQMFGSSGVLLLNQVWTNRKIRFGMQAKMNLLGQFHLLDVVPFKDARCSGRSVAHNLFQKATLRKQKQHKAAGQASSKQKATPGENVALLFLSTMRNFEKNRRKPGQGFERKMDQENQDPWDTGVIHYRAGLL